MCVRACVRVLRRAHSDKQRERALGTRLVEPILASLDTKQICARARAHLPTSGELRMRLAAGLSDKRACVRVRVMTTKQKRARQNPLAD